MKTMKEVIDEMKEKGRSYYSYVDFDKLKALGIRYVMYQPWQFGLFHEDMDGKLLWYPRKGTLMFQNEMLDGTVVTHKIGDSGDWIAGGYNEEKIHPRIHEEILKEMKKIIREQQKHDN